MSLIAGSRQCASTNRVLLERQFRRGFRNLVARATVNQCQHQKNVISSHPIGGAKRG